MDKVMLRDECGKRQSCRCGNIYFPVSYTHLEPKNFEVLHKLYLSIGYYQGKAIVKDENGSFYFVKCEENELDVYKRQEYQLYETLIKIEKVLSIFKTGGGIG